MGIKIVLSRKQCLQKRKQASGRHQFRVPGPGEMAEGAWDSHGGREAPKVPPGPGFQVYIDIDVVARFRRVPARPGPALAPAGLRLAVLPCNYSRI